MVKGKTKGGDTARKEAKGRQEERNDLDEIRQGMKQGVVMMEEAKRLSDKSRRYRETGLRHMRATLHMLEQGAARGATSVRKRIGQLAYEALSAHAEDVLSEGAGCAETQELRTSIWQHFEFTMMEESEAEQCRAERNGKGPR